MKNFLIGLFISIIAVACKSDKDEVSNLVELLPRNSLYIIDTPDINSFLQQTDTVGLFQKYGTLFTTGIKGQIQTIANHSNQKAAIISISQKENGELNYLFIAKEHPGEIITDSIKNKSLETLTYKDYLILKYVIEDITIFKAEKNGVFIAGNSRQQLEQLLEKDHTGLDRDELFIKAHSAIDRNKTSILLRAPALSDIISGTFRNISLAEIKLAEWSLIEIETDLNAISLNGISTWNGEESYLLKTFRNSGTQINQLAKVTPRDAAGFLSFTFQDIDLLLNNLNEVTDSKNNLPSNHFLHYTAEAGFIILKNEKNLPVLMVSDPELARELLIPTQEADIFRGITIYNFPGDMDLFSYFNPLLPDVQAAYYAWIENFILFAENRTDLEHVITAYLNNLILDQQEYYNTAIENLAASSSILLVANNEKFHSSPPIGKSQSEIGADGYPIIAMQFVAERDFAHIHGAYGLPGDQKSIAVQQLATINLDAPIGILPVTIKNHHNGQPEVLVQDEQNVLYLFSTSGALIWQKQFPHQIMGEIQQVDLAGNSSMQFAFSTPYALHVIDRKGNPVKPFPLEFRDEITQPLSIFDYDNNRSYRFVLTQGNNVMMYDSKGRLVRGFDFDKLSSQIIQPPKHIRLNNKDYILIPESSGKLNIMSRQGKPRIEVKEDIEFSASAWFPYKNNFVSISSNGELIKINETGTVLKEPAGENGNVKVSANDQVLVTMADNTLKINDRAVNLDYGLYTSPVVFSSGNKTYVSLTDTQAHRIYLFDENANLLPGFPLFGNSEIRPLTGDNNLNIFSVQGGEDEIILYQF